MEAIGPEGAHMNHLPVALPTGRSAAIASALVAIVLVVASGSAVVHAQSLHTEHGLAITSPTERQPGGGWEVTRDDEQARLMGEAGVVRRGDFRVQAKDGPDFDANSLKLRFAGVLPSPNEPAVPCIGVEWDFHHPILKALGNVEPLLPQNIARPQDWIASDLDLFELGRPAIKYLLARKQLEQMMDQAMWSAFERSVLLWVLDQAPETLPTVPNADDPERVKPYDGDRAVLAALRLGPYAVGTLDKLLAALPEETPAKIRTWAAFIRRELGVLDRAISRSMSSLSAAFPLSGDDRTRWPDPERAAVERFSLSSLRFLEALRAADSVYAPKADWLARWVRREAAADLAARLEHMAATKNLSETHFENPENVNRAASDKPAVEGEPAPFQLPRGSLNGLTFVDDLVVFMLTLEHMPTEAKRLADEASALDRSLEDGAKERAAAKRAASNLIVAAVNRYASQSPATSIVDFAKAMRANPAKAMSLTETFERDTVPGLPASAFGVLLTERAKAAEFSSKMNFMREAIKAQDQNLASDLFIEGSRRLAKEADADIVFLDSDYSELRATGSIRIDAKRAERLRLTPERLERLVKRGYLDVQERDGEMVYWFKGHPAYRKLARLADSDYEQLNRGEGIFVEPGVMFRGAEGNDGRAYDFQNNVPLKGLSIDFVPAPLGPPMAFDLEHGRTYTLSFKYWTKGMDGQYAWIRFVPVDSNGQKVMTMAEEALEEGLTEGEFIPYRFAIHNEDGSLDSNRYTGNTGGWETARFLLNRVPSPVAGFNIEIKLADMSGDGAVYFRDFRLELKRDWFREDFEPTPYRPEPPASAGNRPNLAPVWEFVQDPENRYMPAYSGMTWQAVNLPAGSTRALMIEPKGFNFRMQSSEFFELRHDRQYVFRGNLQTENMGSLRAWFEVMLYDGERRPVTADGLPTTEGENVVRTPARGDELRAISFGGLRVPAGWLTERLHFDELRKGELAELRGPGVMSRIDTRERRDIVFARVAVVAAGPEREYGAKVSIDNIEILEYPRVTLTLGQQMLDPASSLVPGERVWGPPERLNGVMARPAPPQDPDRFRLFIEVAVEGLTPKRAGYHYKLTLHDYLGNPVPALDILGAQKLDRIVHSDANGAIGSEEFNRIFLEDLDLKNTFGYFSATFELRYVDQREPLYQREFLIGFVPPSLLGEEEGRTGDYGVVLDHDSTRWGRVASALSLLQVGRVAFPLFREELRPGVGSYINNSFVTEYDTLMDTLPHIRRTAILGPMPLAIERLASGPGAATVFAEGGRQEWKGLLREAHLRWRDRFDEYVAGDIDDESYSGFTANPAGALDNLAGEFQGNLVGWAPRLIPISIGKPGQQTAMLDTLARSFARRWQPALDAQPQAIRDAISAAVDAPSLQRVRERAPRAIWLRDLEQFGFHIPASVSPQDMSAAVAEVLGLVGRASNVLGDTSADAIAAAQAIAAGQPFDFKPLATGLAATSRHTLFIDLIPVDSSLDTTYADQLRDLTEKLVIAKQAGFGRIFISRLRDSGEIPDGLLTRDNRARPAFYAFRTLNSVLSGTELMPLQLSLQSGAKHQFFRNAITGELTFFIFPGEKDVIEDLPFGHGVRQIDLMGNPQVVSTVGDGGTARVRLKAGGLPVILAGIDIRLMETLLGVNLENPVIQGMEAEQPQGVTITNRFDSPMSVSLRIPLTADEGDLDNIVSDARFRDERGNEVSDQADEYTFASVQLSPGQSHTFKFGFKPRSTMKTGNRVLPIEVHIKGQREYMVNRRMPVTIETQVAVDTIDLMDPPDGRGAELSMKIANKTARNQAFVATVSLPEIEGSWPVTRDFSVGGNASADVTRRLPDVPREKLKGLLVRLSIRQTPSSLFFNQDYRVTWDGERNSLVLVPEQDVR